MAEELIGCTLCDHEGFHQKLSGRIKCLRCNGKGWLTPKQLGQQLAREAYRYATQEAQG